MSHQAQWSFVILGAKFLIGFLFKECHSTRRWWLMPVILATQEAEIRRIKVQSQPGQIVFETLS
jgi:hypothetical protein